MLTGAQLVVQALEDAGVELAFGLPGVHNLALWRALGDSPVRLVGVGISSLEREAGDQSAESAPELALPI